MAETDQATAPHTIDAAALEEDLVARWIIENPNRPGADDVWLRDFGVPVWALIGHLRATGGSTAEVAVDYEVPVEAVNAALAYYELHRSLIDERLAANDAPS
jgi:uncharacterized protein (DUF433 family)